MDAGDRILAAGDHALRLTLAALGVALVAVSCGTTAAPTLAPPIPLTDRLLAAIEMPGDPDWLVADFGSVWVKRDDGNVVRIDPTSHELLATINADINDAGLCQGIGSDGASIWTCSGSDIVRIDPETNAVADVVAAHKVYAQGRLVHAAGRIWILNGEVADRLVGVDVNSFEIGAPIELDAECHDLAVGEGAVWVACPKSNLVLRIEPTSGTVTDRITVTGGAQVAVGPGAIWVATEVGITRIDLDDKSVKTVAMDPAPADEGSVWAADGSVWVRTASPFVTRIDATSAKVLERIEAPEYGPGDIVGFSGSLWASDYVNGFVIHLRADAP